MPAIVFLRSHRFGVIKLPIVSGNYVVADIKNFDNFYRHLKGHRSTFLEFSYNDTT